MLMKTGLSLDLMGKRQSEVVTAYLSADEKAELVKWAEREERSVSWLVARLIREAIANNQRQGDE